MFNLIDKFERKLPKDGSLVWMSSTGITGVNGYSLASSPKSSMALVFALANSSSTLTPSREIPAKKQVVRS